MKRYLSNGGLAAAAVLGLAGCATLPPLPAVNHAPTNQDVMLRTVGGQTHTITVAIPYRSGCAAYASYTAIYIHSFTTGYVGEWNTKIGAMESIETNPARRKAYKNSWLVPPDALVETGTPGMQESNCLGAADLADEDGRTRAHNDLIASPPVP